MTKVLVEGVITTTVILFLGHIIQNTEMRTYCVFLGVAEGIVHGMYCVVGIVQ